MGVLGDKIVETYHYLNYEVQDPRAAEYFYINTPWFWICLDICYVYFVKFAGPRFMKGKAPFQVDGLIRIYNIVQILLNIYVFIQGFQVVTNERFDWQCMPIIYDDSEYSNQIQYVGHFIFWMKVLDLLDTIFFVVRKKFAQISFLHVYHHSIMVFGLWFGIKYAPGGNPIIVCFINSFVHVVMYSYYLLSSINSQYKKSLWWKKHLTQLQIVQFILIATHTSQILYNNSCGYPYWIAMILFVQDTFMSLMFLDFYRKTYLRKKIA